MFALVKLHSLRKFLGKSRGPHVASRASAPVRVRAHARAHNRNRIFLAAFSLCFLFLLTKAFGILSPPPQPLASTPELHPDTDRKYAKTCISAGCHSVQDASGTPQHPPYREGRCLACHNDHATSATAGNHLLKPAGDALCLACHTGMNTTPGGALSHPPGGLHCIDCHNPHQSRVRNLLRDKDRLQDCAKCHANFLNAATKLPYRHHYLDMKTECGQCHYAHRNQEQKFVRENVSETCLTCHDLPIHMNDGRVLENVADRINRAPVVHGALVKGTCATCHTPHGSGQPSLLKAGYPAGSYEKYQTAQYALCWQCHSKAIAENPRGEGVTKFRNGEKNLHWLHVTVNKQGRACHLCHAAHDSDVPHLLRTTAKFGNWTGPLVYKPTETGGSCQTPCHRERSYSNK